MIHGMLMMTYFGFIQMKLNLVISNIYKKAIIMSFGRT